MTQMTELIVASATGMMTVLVGIAVKAVKDYLIQKGGEKAVRIAEILAKNAVHAVEQVASETGKAGTSPTLYLDRVEEVQDSHVGPRPGLVCRGSS